VGTPALLETLCALERRLHRPEVRADPPSLGNRVLAEFTGSRQQDYSIWSQDFELEEIAPDLALLTYRSAHLTPSGGLERHTSRASLWQRGPAGWRMRFHQGAPMEAFEKHAT
jgi:hypothetical protein